MEIYTFFMFYKQAWFVFYQCFIFDQYSLLRNEKQIQQQISSSTIFDHIIFRLLSATRLCKMTWYDLQLHLRYRNSIILK